MYILLYTYAVSIVMICASSYGEIQDMKQAFEFQFCKQPVPGSIHHNLNQ